MNLAHPDYSKLAARIAVSNLHKQTSSDYLEVATKLYNYTDKVGRPAPLLSDEVFEVIKKHHNEINAALDYKRDFEYDYFGFKTLERSYLLKVADEKNGGKPAIAERPQHMLMRVSIGIHKWDLEKAF